MDARDYLLALVRHPLVALLAAAAVVLPVAAVLLRSPVEWTARTTVVLEVAARDTPRELNDGLELAQALVPGVARLAGLPAVLRPAGEALDPPVDLTTMTASTAVRGEAGSAVLTVVATATGPEGSGPAAAAARADAVAGALVAEVAATTPRGGEDDLRVEARVLSTAQEPLSPSGPQRRLPLALAVLGAPLAAVAATSVVDTPARRRRRPAPEDLPDVLVGAGADRRAGRSRRGTPGGEGSRARQELAPVLREVVADRGHRGTGVLAVAATGRAARVRGRTSGGRRRPPRPSGADAVAAGLVTSLGAGGARVLVVDAGPPGPDGRPGGVTGELGVAGAHGVARPGDVVRTTLADLLERGGGRHGRDAAGAAPGDGAGPDVDPVALLAAVAAAGEDYDAVVLLSPDPSTPRGLAVSGAASHVLLVVGRDPGARGDLAAAARLLSPAGPRVHGVVVG